MKDLKPEHFRANLRPLASDDGSMARNILTVLESMPERQPRKDHDNDHSDGRPAPETRD